jgi:hypothetical protein
MVCIWEWEDCILSEAAMEFFKTETYSKAIINEATAFRLQKLGNNLDVTKIGDRVAEIIGLQHCSWLSCVDLTYQSQKELQKRFTNAEFVKVFGCISVIRSFYHQDIVIESIEL